MSAVSEMPPFTRVERADLNSRVYDNVRAALLSGKLSAGEKLSLSAISDQLGVSRSPVHQALTRLAAEGLVDAKSRRGYFVTPITTKTVVEGYEVRLALELMAAERAIGTLAEAELAGLRAALGETLVTMDSGHPWDFRTYIQSNQRFHRVHVDLAGNEELASMYANLPVSLLMERVMADLSFEGIWDQIGEQHRAIYDAYERGDLPAAQKAVREHVELGRQMAVQAIETAGGVR